MLTLALTLFLTQAGPPLPQAGAPKGPPPPPQEVVALYFRGGDLRKAVEHCRLWAKGNKKKAEPIFKALVQYQFLASKSELTPEEAKQFIAFDQLISPGSPGLLTSKVHEKFIDAPLEQAKAAVLANNRERAQQLARGVLLVAPDNAEAKALLESPDAGAPAAKPSK